MNIYDLKDEFDEVSEISDLDNFNFSIEKDYDLDYRDIFEDELDIDF